MEFPEKVPVALTIVPNAGVVPYSKEIEAVLPLGFTVPVNFALLVGSIMALPI